MVDGSGAEVTETRSSNCLKDTQLSAVVVPTKKNVFVGSTFSVTIIMTTSTTATTLTGRRQRLVSFVRCFHFGLFALDFGKYNNEISSYQRIHD